MGVVRPLLVEGLDTVVSLRSKEPSGHLFPLPGGLDVVDCPSSQNLGLGYVATRSTLSPEVHVRKSLVGPSRADNNADANSGRRTAAV